MKYVICIDFWHSPAYTPNSMQSFLLWTSISVNHILVLMLCTYICVNVYVQQLLYMPSTCISPIVDCHRCSYKHTHTTSCSTYIHTYICSLWPTTNICLSKTKNRHGNQRQLYRATRAVNTEFVRNLTLAAIHMHCRMKVGRRSWEAVLHVFALTASNAYEANYIHM